MRAGLCGLATARMSASADSSIAVLRRSGPSISKFNPDSPAPAKQLAGEMHSPAGARCNLSGNADLLSVVNRGRRYYPTKRASSIHVVVPPKHKRETTLDLLFIGEERVDFSRMIQGNRTVSQIIKTSSRPLHATCCAR